MTGLDTALDVFDAAQKLGGIKALRNKSLALTEAFIDTVEARVPEAVIATPRDAGLRGSQVSFSLPHGIDGYAVMQALIARGVIGDFRAGVPELLRFGSGQRAVVDDHFHCKMFADQTRQPLCAARTRDDADGDLRLTELGSLAGNDEVTENRELASPAEAGAVHGGGGRYTQLVHQPENPVKRLDHLGGHVAHVLSHVHSRGKAFSLGIEQHHLEVFLALPLLQDTVHFFHHRDVQNIEWRLVQGDGAQSILEINADESV